MKNKHFEKIGQHSALNPDFAILVPAAQNGGKRSMETICEAFRPLVLSLINKSTYYSIREDAESIAYCEIVECVYLYNGDTYSHFAGFIKSKVVWRLRNALRKECITHGREPLVGEETLESLSSEDSIEELVSMLSERDALRKLPAHYHHLLADLYFAGLSIAEVAAKMGVSHQAVYKMKKKALAMLKELIPSE